MWVRMQHRPNRTGCSRCITVNTETKHQRNELIMQKAYGDTENEKRREKKGQQNSSWQPATVSKRREKNCWFESSLPRLGCCGSEYRAPRLITNSFNIYFFFFNVFSIASHAKGFTLLYCQRRHLWTLFSLRTFCSILWGLTNGAVIKTCHKSSFCFVADVNLVNYGPKFKRAW